MARRLHPVAVRILAGRGAIAPAALRAAAREVMRTEGVATDVGVEVAIADGEAVRELNRRYRGRDEPTDVLSFASSDAAVAFPSTPDEAPSLGEVVVCLPVARSQAAEGGRELEGEIVHLVVHGMLHILGYDHEEAAEGERMKAREDEVLEALGYAGRYRHGH
jgi:probable rRNA maturation factor